MILTLLVLTISKEHNYQPMSSDWQEVKHENDNLIIFSMHVLKHKHAANLTYMFQETIYKIIQRHITIAHII